MKHIACVRLIQWPIDRRRRNAAASVGRLKYPTGVQAIGRSTVIPAACTGVETPCKKTDSLSPLVIVRTVADRQVIVALCPKAAGFGIRLGMTLTQARALCAAVQHAEHEPDRDNRAMEALGRWMMRFTPVICRGAGPERDCLYLDLSGCDRLFGGFEPLVAQIRQALAGLHISARMAVGPTPGAAWALAWAGQDGTIVSPAELPAALAPLPPTALRLSDPVAAALHHLGLATIGQLETLPRDVLPARFGKELLHRLDQAMGRIHEPLTPLEHHAPVEAKMEFDGPVASLEAIESVAPNLLREIVDQLTRRGCGARRLDVELSRAYAPPVRKSILLSHPSREFKSLFNLLQCALEEGRDEPFAARSKEPKPATGSAGGSRPLDGAAGTKSEKSGKAWRDPAFADAPSVNSADAGATRDGNFSIFPVIHDDGYTALHLRVPLLQRLSDEQIFLLDQERQAGRLEVDRLIDRLRLRLGEHSMARVQLVESHLPEKAWKPARPEETVKSDAVKRRGKPANSNLKSPTLNLEPETRPPLRPLHFLPRPVEIRVIVTPCDDAQGDPAAFVHENRVHPIACWLGPERIAGLWWDGHDKTRDYFEVEDPAGRRFWIFRVVQTGKWYLHGSYQ